MSQNIVRYEAPGFIEMKTENDELKQYDPDCAHPVFLIQKAYKPGETIKIDVNTNEYAIEGEYEILWEINLKSIKGGKHYEYCFTTQDIGKHFRIACKIISLKNDWHRHGKYDDQIEAYINVIPE